VTTTTSMSPAVPAPGDLFIATLLDLRARQNSLSEALERAELRTGPVGRTTALSDLHIQIRGMAAVANHALGGWPEPEPEAEPL